MSKETEAIFSSTGRLGVSRRPFDRVYVNGISVSDNPLLVESNFQRLKAIGERHREQIGRTIFRGVVTEDVQESIQQNGLLKHLEVSLPLEEFTGDKSALIYLADNSPDRTEIVSIDEMIYQTEKQNQHTLSPQERVKEVLAKGYSFSTSFSKDQISQVHALWGETFGWSENEVEGLRNRIENPNDNSVWFAAIQKNGTIISVATAERLDIPSTQGILTLIESTEWRTQDEYAGQGLMSATLAMLNAQILSDFHEELRLPLIYAECNFQSRADRAGLAAGFRIPSREKAPQILVQNVHVQDGTDVEEGKLRDFTFMYLPMDVIQTDYDPIQLDAMAKATRP